MFKYILSISLLSFSLSSFAMSFGQAKMIYSNLVNTNHLNPAPHLIYSSDQSINAMTNGFQIIVNAGMLRFVNTNDEMALVLGHELAHGTLHHPRSTPSNELAADKLGSVYMSRAGYNKCTGAQFFRRLNSPGSSTHPSSSRRLANLGCYKYEYNPELPTIHVSF